MTTRGCLPSKIIIKKVHYGPYAILIFIHGHKIQKNSRRGYSEI